MQGRTSPVSPSPGATWTGSPLATEPLTHTENPAPWPGLLTCFWNLFPLGETRSYRPFPMGVLPVGGPTTTSEALDRQRVRL